MRDAYRSLLTALGAVLALWLILGFWPLSTGSRVALSLLVVLVSGVMFWRQRRASGARATAVREIVDENLPPEDFQGAVILVCGDNTPLFVSGFRHRETRQGWYLWVKDAEQLPLLAQHLSLVRPALASQISVMLAVVPEQHISGDDFTQNLRGWQRAVVQCRAAFGTIPPLWTVTWVSPPVACAEAEPVWFTTVSQRSGIQVYQPGQGNVSLTEWTRESGSDGRLSRLSQGLWLDSLLAWQNSAVNDLLSVRQGELPVMKPCVQGMCMVPVSGIAGNLWQQHITSVTALPPDAVVTTEPLPLPELLLPALPRRRGVSRRMVFWRYAGLLGGSFLALAMLASWMNNQRLIRNVGDHLRYITNWRISLLPRNCVRSSACEPMAHCWTTGSVAGSHCVIAWGCIRGCAWFHLLRPPSATGLHLHRLPRSLRKSLRVRKPFASTACRCSTPANPC